ncbi:MAG: hypothetical protein ACREJU_16690 [Nitrospiraceae bacterium]
MRLHITPRRTAIVAMIALWGFITSCASNPKREAVIYEGPRGAVYLEALSPASSQADHPAAIDAPALGLVLSALYIQDKEGLLQSLLAGKPKPVRVFSDKEIRFLTPFLWTALSKASPRQQVGFFVTHPVDPGQEMTKASIFASGPSLYLTLNQYRDNPDRMPASETFGRRLPDSSGLSHRTVLFQPVAAGIDEHEPPFARRGTSPVTLVVNYEQLKKAARSLQGSVAASATDSVKTGIIPPPTGSRSDARSTDTAAEKQGFGAPHQPTSPGPVKSEVPASQDLPSLKELIVQKDLEIEALKGELRELRRQLSKQQAESKSAEKRTPKKHSPNARP